MRTLVTSVRQADTVKLGSLVFGRARAESEDVMTPVAIKPAVAAKLASVETDVEYESALEELLAGLDISLSEKAAVREAMEALPRPGHIVLQPHDPLPKILRMSWWIG